MRGLIMDIAALTLVVSGLLAGVFLILVYLEVI